ncbi:uncharacterized protein LOC142537118 [Primulina tabacum]|uniref:uncharacterized protein LOC142537118 n=1 Tax=Primulina tabacum TaxID=48773 RepID=UPI003F5A7D69
MGRLVLIGCGVGVVILSPPGEKTKLALRIDSRVTNNEAEYEVVISSIRAAREVGDSWIILYSDSQLITQQIKGVYEAKDDRMLKYLQLIQAQAETFVDWSIEQIPREENGEVDALTKMAASLTENCPRTKPKLKRSRDKLPVRHGYRGPLPNCSGSEKFLLVAVDYFSKWVEVEPLAKITEQEVLKFLWKNIVCRFGVPRKLISDNGRQFQGKEITSWCRKMKITQSFTSVAYHQANGQTEVVNRVIVQALKTRLQGKGKDWVEELPSILWAYRTTPPAPTQETPFNLVYGFEAILPIEIGQTSHRVESYPDDNYQSRAMELDLVEEKRDRAFIRMEAYRSRVMKSYNKKVGSETSK